MDHNPDEQSCINLDIDYSRHLVSDALLMRWFFLATGGADR
jgi:hypothetical protein